MKKVYQILYTSDGVVLQDNDIILNMYFKHVDTFSSYLSVYVYTNMKLVSLKITEMVQKWNFLL